MTADELLATLTRLYAPTAATGDTVHNNDAFIDAYIAAWPDIVACLERLAAAEADADRDARFNARIARRSQP